MGRAHVAFAILGLAVVAAKHTLHESAISFDGEVNKFKDFLRNEVGEGQGQKHHAAPSTMLQAETPNVCGHEGPAFMKAHKNKKAMNLLELSTRSSSSCNEACACCQAFEESTFDDRERKTECYCSSCGGGSDTKCWYTPEYKERMDHVLDYRLRSDRVLRCSNKRYVRVTAGEPINADRYADEAAEEAMQILQKNPENAKGKTALQAEQEEAQAEAAKEAAAVLAAAEAASTTAEHLKKDVVQQQAAVLAKDILKEHTLKTEKASKGTGRPTLLETNEIPVKDEEEVVVLSAAEQEKQDKIEEEAALLAKERVKEQALKMEAAKGGAKVLKGTGGSGGVVPTILLAKGQSIAQGAGGAITAAIPNTGVGMNQEESMVEVSKEQVLKERDIEITRRLAEIDEYGKTAKNLIEIEAETEKAKLEVDKVKGATSAEMAKAKQEVDKVSAMAATSAKQKLGQF